MPANATTSQREENKILNHAERRSGLTVITSMPLVAKIEITTRCNLACRMCATSFSQKRRADLSYELFSKLTGTFPYLLSAYLYGIGEPLLHPDLSRMIDTLIGHEVNTGIITNGTLITEGHAREWVEKGLYKVSISIDGATQKTYETIRRGSSFAALCKNIAGINKFKAEYGSQRPYITFNFVTMRSNLHELGELVELAAQNKVSEVIVSDLLVFDDSMRDEKVLFSDPLLHDAYEEAEEKARALGVRLFLPNTFLAWRRDRDQQESKSKTVPSTTKKGPCAICTEPWSSFWFTQEGDVTPCCYWFLKMGNVNETDFKTIWNGRAYQNLRGTVNSSARPHQCRQCPIP